MTRDNRWSVTDRELHDEIRTLRERDATVAIATVIDVEGSAYRRPGAKLLAPAEGETLGAITAGCLEGPVADLAADARETGAITVETFDLMEDNEWGLGLGCNGVIDVLVEPLDDTYDTLVRTLDDGTTASLLTVVDSDDDDVPVGSRATVTEDGPETGSDRQGIPADVLPALQDTAAKARADGSSSVIHVEREAGDLRVFVDGVKPAPDLILFGAQNDVNAIAQLGVQAGFRVTVASPRGARADASRFPNAHRVQTTHPTEITEVIDDPESTYVVLLSHNLIDDRLALEALLSETDVPYVGLMGPRERFEEIRDASEEDGQTFTATELKRVSTPVGLDLGDGGPVGIAMSVVSELIAVANGADGGRLAERSGPIHPRPTPSG